MSDPPFTPPMQFGGLGRAADISPPMPAEDTSGSMGRAPPGLFQEGRGDSLGYSQRPAPPNQAPPPPPSGVSASPALAPGGVLGLLGPNAPVAADPRVDSQPGQRQPQRQAIGAGRAVAKEPGPASGGSGDNGQQKQDEDPEWRRPKQDEDLDWRRRDVPHEPKAVGRGRLTGAVGEAVPRDRQSLAPGGSVGSGGVGGRPSGKAAGEKAPSSDKQHDTQGAEKRFDASAISRRKQSGDAWDTPSGDAAATTRSPVAKPRGQSGSEGGGISWEGGQQARQSLIRNVFRACDVNEDDWLGECEFRNIAIYFGFKGTDEDWSAEFRKLCDEKHADPAKGIGPSLFMQLVSDDKSGLESSNDDLRKILRKLEESNAKSGIKTKTQSSAMDKPEEDEFYNKLKRTVNWYNKHGGLTEQIRLAQVAEVLTEIKPGQAMKILYDLDTAGKETLPDPTGWIIAEARKRRQANENIAAGKGKGEGRSDSGSKPENTKTQETGKTDSKGAAYTATAGQASASGNWRSGASEYQKELKKKEDWGDSKGAAKGKPKDEQGPEGEEEDEFRSKMRRTVNWYNRHGGLLAPIRFNEVISGLGNTDPRVALRILNDLDQANAEAVLNDPTKWILEECRRRAAGDKGGVAASSPKPLVAGASTDAPLPKPGALSKLGGLTSMPMRLGPPPKKAAAKAAAPAGAPSES